MNPDLILLPIDLHLHVDKKRVMDLNNETLVQTIKTEILVWLVQNIDVWNVAADSNGEIELHEYGYSSFVFHNEEDAMAFKLMWS